MSKRIDANKTLITMKYLFLMLLLFLMFSSSFGQGVPPCQKVEIAKTDAEKEVLAKVIAEWKRERYFIADHNLHYKGVVFLTIGKNKDGLKRWGLTPWIADDYKGDPPITYSEYDGSIILIYNEDERGNLLPVGGDKEARNKCLSEIIGDRLFINPPPTPELHRKMVEVTLPNGQERMIESQTNRLGNSGGQYWIIFNKDGTYQKIPMA